MLTELETLTHLLAKGIPAGHSFRLLAEATEGPRRFRWAEGALILEQGGSLSRALRHGLGKYPSELEPYFALTDRTSRPETLLIPVLRHLRREKELAGRIISALVYPLAVLLLSQLGGALFLLVALPAWCSAGGLPTPDPWPFLRPWLTLLSLTGVVAAALLNPSVRSKLPLAGSYFRLREDYRLFRTLTILAAEGYPLGEAILQYRDDRRLNTILRALSEGKSPTAAFLSGGRLSPEAKLWLKAGEATGNTALILARIADGLEQSLRRQTRMLLPLVEPLFLLITGILLLPVLLSVLTALLSMMERAG